MKTFLALLIFILAIGAQKNFAADKDKADAPLTKVRMRFVPGGPPAKGATDFKGASWTALVPGPEKGVLWCQAHAGIGDEYPVTNEEGVKLFNVRLVEGDDDHVVLEIRSKETAEKIDLPRDKPGSTKVAGIKYDLSYPSVSVGATPGEKPTTNKAMLMITRRL